MKTTMMIMTATVVLTGVISVAALKSTPTDRSEIRREKAEKAMVQAYGTNWFAVYSGCTTTNRAMSRTMTHAYETALGRRPAK